MAKSNQKGSLLEAVVASLHGNQGVTVQRNIRLLAKGSKRRKPEIDVLVTSQVAGYTVAFAVECKNYNKVIGTPKINEFIGKLIDVGIPPQMGIYVATKGYTKGAVERAQKDGLRLLLLNGLDDEGISSKVIAAIQSVIYVLPYITQITISNNSDRASPTEDLALFDESGQYRCTVLDLIWERWLNGTPYAAIGQHKFDISLPIGLYQNINGRFERPISIVASVLVRGYGILISGSATTHQLINIVSQKAEKSQSKLTFDSIERRYPLHVFETEESLAKFMQERPEQVKLTVGRVRLPRIRMGNLYWPVSQRVRSALDEFLRTREGSEITSSNLSEFFDKIEGDDLVNVWDSI